MRRVVVMDIGCLECHNESNLLGIYDGRAEALAAHDGLVFADELGWSDWRGESLVVGFVEGDA
jgi:hypothetical protein